MSDQQQTDEQVDEDAQQAVDEALAAQDDGEAPEGQQDAQDAPEDDEGSSPNREAAKYRTRLREAEAQRDALQERLQTTQRREAERIAADEGRLRKPAAIWAGGAELAAMLDDDGNVDRDKVVEACDQVSSELGLTRIPKPMYVPNEGNNPPPYYGDHAADIIRGRQHH